MMLFADESVDRPIVERLRQDGHDTLYVAELAPSIKDEQVLQEAESRNALLVTEDKDFGELVYRLGRVHAGVILIRLAGLPSSLKADTVAKVLQDHAAELPGAFSVIPPEQCVSAKQRIVVEPANQRCDKRFRRNAAGDNIL